ncbi:MAG: hypothetical protein IEMM0007_0363 [bacterium]|nr:MAG: hypothetical protein IEMM0007_0363 [bacterium]
MVIMKQVRIGNQTAFSASSLTLPFEYAVANGFDAFEWFPDKHESGGGWDVSDMGTETRCYVKNTAVAHDIALSVHASLKANPMIPEAHGLLINEFGFAQDIGATLLNLHLHTDEGLDSYVKAITPIVMLSAKIGIRLSIENTPLTPPDDFNRLFRLFREMGAAKVAHIGMCLDVGHANLCNATRNNYLGFIEQLDPLVPVIHIHMHENYGDSDSHLAVFTGPSREDPSGIQEFVELMMRRRFSGSVILEQWPQPHSLLNQARDRLYQMFIQGEE